MHFEIRNLPIDPHEFFIHDTSFSLHPVQQVGIVLREVATDKGKDLLALADVSVLYREVGLQDLRADLGISSSLK